MDKQLVAKELIKVAKLLQAGNLNIAQLLNKAKEIEATQKSLLESISQLETLQNRADSLLQIKDRHGELSAHEQEMLGRVFSDMDDTWEDMSGKVDLLISRANFFENESRHTRLDAEKKRWQARD